MGNREFRKAAWWSMGAVATLGLYAVSRRTRGYENVAEELRSAFSRFQSPSIGPVTLPLAQAATRRPTRCVKGVELEVRHIEGPDGQPLPIYIYRPRVLKSAGAAMLYTHGGGMIIGSAPAYHENVSAFARDLGIVVVSAEYRLAPQHPFPAPLDDVHTAYRWLVASTEELGVDARNIVVAGESAGGGLTAALCQRVHDLREQAPVFQLLIYPMLDDRTAATPPDDHTGQILWTRASNHFGWTSYLGHAPGRAEPDRYSVPARREDVSGLPPAWIGVGTLDLFHDEDVEYARRLNEAGVACDLVVIDGGFHGFDGFYPATAVARRFRGSAIDAVARAISGA